MSDYSDDDRADLVAQIVGLIWDEDLDQVDEDRLATVVSTVLIVLIRVSGRAGAQAVLDAAIAQENAMQGINSGGGQA